MNAEQQAEQLFREFLAENREELRPIARWGDGCCGYFLEMVREELMTNPAIGQSAASRKAKIPRALSKAVFERDAYRCVVCGDHHDLTCDHTTPESKGGQTAFDNLRTMCRTCNSRKGARE